MTKERFSRHMFYFPPVLCCCFSICQLMQGRDQKVHVLAPLHTRTNHQYQENRGICRFISLPAVLGCEVLTKLRRRRAVVEVTLLGQPAQQRCSIFLQEGVFPVSFLLTCQSKCVGKYSFRSTWSVVHSDNSGLESIEKTHQCCSATFWCSEYCSTIFGFFVQESEPEA